jgi:hypothetical protein
VVYLELDQPAHYLGAVHEPPRGLELAARNTHFLSKAATRRVRRRLVRPRMPATRVRPEERGVILPGRAALDQHAARVVEEEHRHRAV